MTRRTQLVSMLGLGSALLISSAAYAQAPGARPGAAPGAPGAAGAAGAAVETGAVTNETTTTSTTTTTDTGGALLTDDTGTLPNTGGAPWLMALAGSVTAGSGLMLRRKLS